MLVSERDCETRDNTRKDIQKLGGSVKLVRFMNESEEALVNSLSYHLTSWNQFGVQLMQDIFEVVSLHGLFRVEEFQEFLYKLRGDVHLERPYFNSFIDNKLQKEFIDPLQMWPGWLNLIFGFHSSLGELKILFLEIGKWPENVFLNHGHNIVEVRNNETDNRFLILQKLLNLVNSIKSFGLAFNIFALILVVIVLLADQQLLLERLLGVLGSGATGSSLPHSLSTSCSGFGRGSLHSRFGRLLRTLLLHFNNYKGIQILF